MIDQRAMLVRAYKCALGSPDPRTQNGAVLTLGDLIIAQSCNTLPRGVGNDPARLEPPAKYEFIEHAERNAIYAAARTRGTLGSTMYCAWAACADCARAIIQAGVYKLVRHHDATVHGSAPIAGGASHWNDSISTADLMMREAGIEIIDIVGKLTDFEIMHAGELWSP